MNFDFNPEKNELLISERNVSFYDIIESIAEKGVLLDFEHPNKEKYPNQRIFVVEFQNYTYCVPYIFGNGIYFLKTIFPSRKFMKLLDGE